MSVVSAKISEEKLEAIKRFCLKKGTTVSGFVQQALEGVLRGEIKIKEKPQVIDICPECGSRLFYKSLASLQVIKKELGYEGLGPKLFCINCGYWRQIELPEGKWHEDKKEETSLAK